MKPLQSDPNIKKPVKKVNTIAHLVKYLWPQNRSDLQIRVLLALVFLAVAKLINVYAPIIYRDIVDLLSVKDLKIIIPVGLIIAYGSARVLTLLFGELRDFVFIRVSQHAQRIIALSTFKHLHDLSLAYHLDRQTGGLSRIIERGVKGIQFLLTFMLFNILPTILEIFLVAIILYVKFNWIFSLITVLTIVCYTVFTLAITEWRLKFRRDMNDSDNRANTRAIDSLINYETVKYFSNERHEFNRYNKALKSYEQAAVKSQTSLSFLNIGQGLIIGIGMVLVMYLAAGSVSNGIMTIGDFVLVNTYLFQLYLPLNFLGFVYREIKRSLVDMHEMFLLMQQKSDITDKADAKDIKIKNAIIEFENVSFSYSSKRNILQNISFVVKSGHKVAIVGSSGAGKSTILRALFRFYEISSGSIKLDSTDIRDIRQNSLRNVIGVVPQDTVLFNDSIYYNIMYGNPEASHNQIIKAAKLAHIHKFIMKLPEKYETRVGERGLKLSGGEKQRVAIARTILKNPPILLFDEATSALDSHTEKEIEKSLNEVSQNKTTIVIAHRLSTVINADEILVLSNGKITERGKHRQLLSKKGDYYRMWQKQQEVKEYQKKLESVDIKY